MVMREKIINILHKSLEPLAYIHSFWLEAADANGTVDTYSDLDFWVDCDDEYEMQAMDAVEAALMKVSNEEDEYQHLS